MFVGVVAVIITEVVIILLDVSSLATPGTAQTLAHNNSGFTGRQNILASSWTEQNPTPQQHPPLGKEV